MSTMVFYPATEAQEQAFVEMIEGYERYRERTYGRIPPHENRVEWIVPIRSPISPNSFIEQENPFSYSKQREIVFERCRARYGDSPAPFDDTCPMSRIDFWYNKEVWHAYLQHLRIVTSLAEECVKNKP